MDHGNILFLKVFLSFFLASCSSVEENTSNLVIHFSLYKYVHGDCEQVWEMELSVLHWTSKNCFWLNNYSNICRILLVVFYSYYLTVLLINQWLFSLYVAANNKNVCYWVELLMQSSQRKEVFCFTLAISEIYDKTIRLYFACTVLNRPNRKIRDRLLKTSLCNGGCLLWT